MLGADYEKKEKEVQLWKNEKEVNIDNKSQCDGDNSHPPNCPAERKKLFMTPNCPVERKKNTLWFGCNCGWM